MNSWIKDNAISIAIALVTMVSTYAVYGYRLSAVEARQDRQGTAIVALQDSSNQTNVALARIQTDIEYIKTQLQQISNRQLQ